MLAPCWFTLWTSSRFLHAYILLISLEIFFYNTATVHGVPSDEDIALICQRVAHKWKLLGVQLGVYPAELDQIASECGSDQSCCSELFRKWSAIEITASCPFTWKGVIEILDSESVGESPLARNLESTHI